MLSSSVIIWRKWCARYVDVVVDMVDMVVSHRLLLSLSYQYSGEQWEELREMFRVWVVLF